MGNKQICVIDTETTGLDVIKSKIIELSIIPLTKQFQIDQSKPPLHLYINPGEDILNKGKNALLVNKLSRDIILNEGKLENQVSSFIEGWLTGVNIDIIIPLAQNWSFDKRLLINLLGQTFFEKHFYRKYHDTMIVSEYINTRYFLNNKPEPFESSSLVKLSEHFKIPHDAHNSIGDCLATVEVYKKLLTYPLP